MTSREAVLYALNYYQTKSKYELARLLSDDAVKVQPIQITMYLRGAYMSRKVADRFLACFDIVVSTVKEKGMYNRERSMDS